MKQTGYFPWFSVAVCLQLRVDQIPVDGDLKTASIGRNQRERFDLKLEFPHQFGCQTDSTICIVSNRTIFQLNVVCHLRASMYFNDVLTQYGSQKQVWIKARLV